MKVMRYYLLSLLVFSAPFLMGKTYKSVGKNSNQKFSKLRTKKQLFTNLGCTYMNKMIVDCHDCLVDVYQTQEYKDNAQQLDAASAVYSQDVLQATLAPMYLKFISPVVGYGVFAKDVIRKNQFIGVYAGDLRYTRWGDAHFQEDLDYAWSYTVNSISGKSMVIDSKYRGNELRFINHSNNPNTKRIDVVVNGIFYICYVAQSDISPDTQLTVSYGDAYWSSRQLSPENVSVNA